MNKHDKLIERFRWRYPNILFLRSSADPEIKRFFERTQAEASTSMDDNGKVVIMLNDLDCTKSAVLEEMAHAIQFINDGQISIPSVEHLQREVEVKECLVDRQHRSKLTKEETTLSRNQITMYKNKVKELQEEGYQ